MREIKFRAWDKTFKRMKVTGMGINNGVLWGEDINIMQYTGLKDKNGKEIYEGDIISGLHKNGDSRKDPRTKLFNHVVFWNEGSSGWSMRTIGDVFKGDYRWFPFWNECEVIGNIYTNPEL